MNSIVSELERLTKFKEYIADIENKVSPIVISGLSDVGMVQNRGNFYSHYKY